MKLYILLIFNLLWTTSFSCKYNCNISLNNDIMERNELRGHIKFLASDELRGRKVGTHEAKIAARYVAEQFRKSGLQAYKTFDGYMQKVYLMINDRVVKCQNVIGFIEGSNTKLKKEYILLCAHYDHLGVKANASEMKDSIYNGARDNAMGVTALIYAANKLSVLNPARSIIFLATTGEEDGMLGSKYFVDHCPVKLKNIVFVLNNDGGGFNDTSLVRIGGKNKINFSSNFWNVTSKYDIECLAYPKELEYLYEKGDNISFAQTGIPSITISPGFNEINEEILKYVHQPADEANDDFNYSYLSKFCQVYADLAIVISNSTEIPGWNKDYNYNKD